MRSKRKSFSAGVAAVLFCGVHIPETAAQQSDSFDRCRVYAVDLGQAAEARDAPEAQELAALEGDEGAGRVLGAFAARVYEEELTTRDYPLTGTDRSVTASVFYTDEGMSHRGRSDSILLAVVVAPAPYDDALVAENGARGQFSLASDDYAVRVETRVRVDGRLFLVGLECRSDGETGPHSPALGEDPEAFADRIAIDPLRPVEIRCEMPSEMAVTITIDDERRFRREYPKMLHDLAERRRGVLPLEAQACAFTYQGVVFDRWP